MTSAQIIDFELRERVRELTERLEPTERCLLRNDGPTIDFEVEWVIRTIAPAGPVDSGSGR